MIVGKSLETFDYQPKKISVNQCEKSNDTIKQYIKKRKMVDVIVVVIPSGQLYMVQI